VADGVPLLGTVARGYGEMAAGIGDQGVLGFAQEMNEGYEALRQEAYDAAAEAGASAARATYDYLQGWFQGGS
jgi:hypothetical protein